MTAQRWNVIFLIKAFGGRSIPSLCILSDTKCKTEWSTLSFIVLFLGSSNRVGSPQRWLQEALTRATGFFLKYLQSFTVLVESLRMHQHGLNLHLLGCRERRTLKGIDGVPKNNWKQKTTAAFGNNVRSKSCLQPFFKQLFHLDVSGAWWCLPVHKQLSSTCTTKSATFPVYREEGKH